MKVSAWDRTLLRVAPGWALNRLRKRAAFEVVARHYEAAQPGRRTQGWARSSGDADVSIRGAAFELRTHARDLIRNNGWARRAQRIVANNTIGWGLRPKAVGDDPSIVAKAGVLWKAWAETTECESEGRHTFYGLQSLVMKALVADGEVLIRRRWRRAKDNLTLPLQLQILEADYLDTGRNNIGADSSTGPTISGVEFDLIGRRTAYWLFKNHPGSGRNTDVSVRVPASEVIHVYYTERPGQSRGVSWYGAAIAPLKDFDQYEDATLMRQMIASCFAAFVTDLDGSGMALGATDTDPLVEKFEPGMITQLPPGKQVSFASPPVVNDSTFDARTLRRIASTLGVTYEELTGDYSQVNFSSARMARISHWENICDWRENMIIPLLCNGVWAWAMEAAVVAGELPPQAQSTGVQWTSPPMAMIEPDKEGLAYSRLIRNGLMTHAEAIREQGRDPDAHFLEYKAGLDKLDELEIVLDSDPRKTTGAGQEQPSDAMPPEPAAPVVPDKKQPAKREVDAFDIDDALELSGREWNTLEGEQ